MVRHGMPRVIHLILATLGACASKDRRLQASYQATLVITTKDGTGSGTNDALTVTFPSNPGSPSASVTPTTRDKSYTTMVEIVGDAPTSISLQATGNDAACVAAITLDGAAFTGVFPAWIDANPEYEIRSNIPWSTERTWVRAGPINSATLRFTLCDDHNKAQSGHLTTVYFPTFFGSGYANFRAESDVVETELTYTGPLPTEMRLVSDSYDALCLKAVSLDGFEFTGPVMPFWLDKPCSSGFHHPCFNFMVLEMATTSTTTSTSSMTTSTTVTETTATETTTTVLTQTMTTQTITTQTVTTQVLPAQTPATQTGTSLPPDWTAPQVSTTVDDQAPASTQFGSNAESTTQVDQAIPSTTIGPPAPASTQFQSDGTAADTAKVSQAFSSTTIGPEGIPVGAVSETPSPLTTSSKTVDIIILPTTGEEGPSPPAGSTLDVAATGDTTAVPHSTTAEPPAAMTSQGTREVQSTLPAANSEGAATSQAASVLATTASNEGLRTTRALPSVSTPAQASNGAYLATTEADATRSSDAAATSTAPWRGTVTEPAGAEAVTTRLAATSSITDATTKTTTPKRTSTATDATSPNLQTTESPPTAQEERSSTTTTTGRALAKSWAVVRAMEAGIASLLSDNTSTNATLDTSLGTVNVFSLTGAKPPSGKRLSFPSRRGAKVSVPQKLLTSLPANAVLAILSIESQAGGGNRSEDTDPFGDVTGGSLASEVMDISLYDSNGQAIKVELSEPLLFKLPGTGSKGKCVFLDSTGPGPPRWSTRGVWRASDDEVRAAGESPAGQWCYTKHLSIFAAIAEAILGCTNLELLSPAAARGVLEHEGWHKANSALIVFFVWGLLIAALLLGNLRERWALRLGRSHEAWKSVQICRNFLKLGPQLLKHRYVAFVVYAKDLLHCMRTGRQKLKKGSLTSSTQRFLAVRRGISVQCVAQHCWNGAGWISTGASLPYTVICDKLQFHAGMAEKVIQEDLLVPGLCGFLRRFAMTFLALHPLLDSMRVGASSMTVGKRTTLQVAGICGVIATNALIFNFSGSLRSWEADAECPINPTSQLFVVVASMVSVIVNAVPNSFLTDLGRQVHGRPLWNLTFWAWTFLYLSWAVFVIVVALSNLNPKDQAKWYAALEWGMTIKLVGMPCAQTMRNSLMMEIFLRDDGQCKPSQRFRVVMGLCHPKEAPLSNEMHSTATVAARQAISTQELVTFTALLGSTVMPDFQPEKSTAEDVMQGAIEPLSVRPRPLEDFAVRVEVVEATGLPDVEKKLTCSVCHLGQLARGERVSRSERKSEPQSASSVGNARCCHWAMEAFVTGLGAEEALGFVVAEEGRTLCVAALSTQQLLNARLWSGTLLLHPAQDGGKGFKMPNEAASVPRLEALGSQGCKAKPLAWLTVNVELPEGYLEALGLHAFQKIKFLPLQNHSDVWENQMSERLSKAHIGTAAASHGTATSFCEEKDGCLPAETMVVHSRKKNFVHLVATVLTDALGDHKLYKAVESKIFEKDFHGLQDILRDAGCEEKRYWMEIFALPATRNEGWHEDFMSYCPTILREMRRVSCEKVVADIQARKIVDKPSGALTQLLVMDRSFHFMHEISCLAELMLANAMRVRQRIVLHPEHLVGGGLGKELRCLAMELGKTYNENEAAAYAAPYLDNKQAVYDTLKDLIVRSVKEQKQDDESTMQELGMTDIAATIGAVEAGRSYDDSRAGGRDDDVQMEDMVEIDVE